MKKKEDNKSSSSFLSYFLNKHLKEILIFIYAFAAGGILLAVISSLIFLVLTHIILVSHFLIENKKNIIVEVKHEEER